MGANGQLGRPPSAFVDPQTNKGYQTIGYFEGMPIVTRSEKSSASTPVTLHNVKVIGVVAFKKRGQIRYISFFDKNTGKIKKSIDFVYDSDGNVVLSHYKIKNGKKELVGTHWHNWHKDGDGDQGRVTHGEDNRFMLTQKELKWVEKADRYNKSHK